MPHGFGGPFANYMRHNLLILVAGLLRIAGFSKRSRFAHVMATWRVRCLFSRPGGLPGPQAARKLQEEVKAAHDEVVGLEWNAVRGYANAKPKTILRHRLAGRSESASRHPRSSPLKCRASYGSNRYAHWHSAALLHMTVWHSRHSASESSPHRAYRAGPHSERASHPEQRAAVDAPAT
jgi:hypothetical protein